jgi:hypothetical protein
LTLFNSLKACHPPDSSHAPAPVSENANHGVDCDAACSLQDGQQLALLLHRAGLNEDDAGNARQQGGVQPNAAATDASSAHVSSNDGAASTSLHPHAGPMLTSEVAEGDRNCIRSWMQVSRHTCFAQLLNCICVICVFTPSYRVPPVNLRHMVTGD